MLCIVSKSRVEDEILKEKVPDRVGIPSFSHLPKLFVMYLKRYKYIIINLNNHKLYECIAGIYMMQNTMVR